MDIDVAQRLRTYIEAEMQNSALYQALSTMAPDDDDRQLLLEFSEDDDRHASAFRGIYRAMTGRSYHPTIGAPQLVGAYPDILRERVLAESGDYRKYGEQYLLAKNNEELRNAFYHALIDDNVHALRILYMLGRGGQ